MGNKVPNHQPNKLWSLISSGWVPVLITDPQMVVVSDPQRERDEHLCVHITPEKWVDRLMIHQMILTSISSNIIYHVAGKLLASPWLPKKLLFSLPTIQAGSKYRHLVKLLPRRTMVMQQLWRFCWPQSAASCIGSQLTVTNHPKSVETKKYTRCIRGVTLFKEAGIIWIKLSQYVRIHEIPSGCRTKVFTKVLSSLVRTLWPPSSKVTSPVTLPARVQLWITTRLAMFDPLIFALRLCRFIHYGNEKNEEKSSGNGWKKNNQTNRDKTSDLHETKFWNKVRDDRVDGGESVLKRPADRFFRVESVQRFFSGWTIPTSNSWNSSAPLLISFYIYIYI